MRRREVIKLVGGAVVGWPLAARAQPGRVPTVGVLWHAGSAQEELPLFEAFRQGIKELGTSKVKISGWSIAFPMRFPSDFVAWQPNSSS